MKSAQILNTRNIATLITFSFALPAFCGTLQAAETSWSVVPYVGISSLSEQSGTAINVDELDRSGTDVSPGSGFVAGISLRHEYARSRWSSDVGWEYRTNDASTAFVNGDDFAGGDYASNTFYINARYKLNEGRKFTPWLGGGLSVIQEVDLDATRPDQSLSFSSSGSLGWQIMAGVNYDLTRRLYVTTEFRYTAFTDLNLDNEQTRGLVSGIDYDPITLAIGLGFRF